MIPDEDAPIDESKFTRKATQAQIKAAADRLMYLFTERGRPTYEEMAKAALAAEVDDIQALKEKWQKFTIVDIRAERERCARAVWDAGGDNVEFHCAAIRALKDKP